MNNKLIWGTSAVAVVAAVAFTLNPVAPPEQTAHPMTPPDTSTLSQGDPIVVVTLPATLSGDAQIGKRVFDLKCASCHGENAAGQEGIAPPLVHKIYEPGHHSDAAFLAAARRGVRAHHWRFGNMPPVDGLTDADVKYIAGYVRELQRENGIN